MSDLSFEELLSRLLDGSLGEQEAHALANQIATDEALRTQYRYEIQMAESLSQLTSGDRSPAEFTKRLDERLDAESQKFDFLNGVIDRCSMRATQGAVRRWAPWAVAAMAASVLLSFTAGLWTGRQSGSTRGETHPVVARSSSEPVDDSVAIVKRSVDVAWISNNELVTGDSVSAGELIHMESGWLQLQFFQGATMTVQGPARFEVGGRSRVVLHEGNAWAQVPVPARGFTILTPDTEIVDLGTEFGVVAMLGLPTEVHVFDGLVELYEIGSFRDTQTRRELVTGESITVNFEGHATTLTDRVMNMPADSLWQQKQDEQQHSDFRRWRAWSENMSHDPRVLLHYRFDSPKGHQAALLNHASTQQRQSDGAVVGGTWTQGRWPEKSALEFKRPSDRVRFHLPGEFDSITLAAWVRVDGLDRQLSSLLLTDRWDNGEVHWQFDQQGQLGLSIRGSVGTPWCYTPPLVDLKRARSVGSKSLQYSMVAKNRSATTSMGSQSLRVSLSTFQANLRSEPLSYAIGGGPAMGWLMRYGISMDAWTSLSSLMP